MIINKKELDEIIVELHGSRPVLVRGRIYTNGTTEQARVATYVGVKTSPKYDEETATRLRGLPKINGLTPGIVGMGPPDVHSWLDMKTGETFVDNNTSDWQLMGGEG